MGRGREVITWKLNIHFQPSNKCPRNPEGMYIVYHTKQKIEYKSMTNKNISKWGNIEPKGYYVSHYRYYPVSKPKTLQR